jgi:uroporphyrinogen decarboxylase
MTEWIQAIINSKESFALPIMTHSGIEMIGKSVNEAVTDGKVHAEAVKALSKHYSSIASTVIMDLTVEAEAFGAKIQFSPHEVPTVIGRLVSDMKSVEDLVVPSIDTARIPEYILANKLVSEDFDKPIFAGCIGPYSLAGRLYDMSEIMMAVYIDPECTRLLLQKCTDFIISYCKALKNAGSNGVIIAEPAAGLLSNDICLEFSSKFVKQIVDGLQDDYFSVILHNCGNTGQCTKAMVYTGAAAYHFGNAIDMVKALDEVPENSLAMGNLDPVSLFKMATPDTVYNETVALLEKVSKYSNFVISTGCDTPPEIPFENINMFYKAVADYNARK